MNKTGGFIGYTCAYTPLPLLHAAGFTPYRILPMEDSADRAGHILHDNLCPHVKRILDRAMGGEIPLLAGVVFMNSCDSMRRLYDAWQAAVPGVKSVLIDLPVHASESTVGFFRGELARLARFLEELGGSSVTDESIARGLESHNRLSSLFDALQKKAGNASLKGGAAALQEAYNLASTSPPSESIARLEAMLLDSVPAGSASDGVPIHLFGNVLPEPGAFVLFESCGARIVSEDVCTGSRLFLPLTADKTDPYLGMARSLLGRRPCARTFDPGNPGVLAEAVASGARDSGARGVIGYTAKFCDPYIARIPGIRDALRREGIPFLLLEGDCSLRSMGQHRTRIEAFIEMMR